MKNLGIIIVSYNDEINILKKCLDSIENSTNITLEVAIVDNAQNDQVKELISNYKKFKYIRNERNLGFAGALNIGFSKIKNVDYYLSLNGDVYFKDGILSEVYQRLITNPEIGIASTKMLYPNGELQKSVRRFPNFQNQFLLMTKLAKIFNFKAIDKYLMTDFDLNQISEVESVMGAFMFMRADLVKELNGFDDQYFLWYEEVDFCKSAFEKGEKIMHFGDLEVYHYKGQTFNKILTWRKQKWMRDSLKVYAKKWFSPTAYFFWILLQPIFYLAALPAAIIKKK